MNLTPVHKLITPVDYWSLALSLLRFRASRGFRQAILQYQIKTSCLLSHCFSISHIHLLWKPLCIDYHRRRQPRLQPRASVVSFGISTTPDSTLAPWLHYNESWYSQILPAVKFFRQTCEPQKHGATPGSLGASPQTSPLEAQALAEVAMKLHAMPAPLPSAGLIPGMDGLQLMWLCLRCQRLDWLMLLLIG